MTTPTRPTLYLLQRGQQQQQKYVCSTFPLVFFLYGANFVFEISPTLKNKIELVCEWSEMEWSVFFMMTNMHLNLIVYLRRNRERKLEKNTHLA